MIASRLATSCRRRGGRSGGHRPHDARQRGRARLAFRRFATPEARRRRPTCRPGPIRRDDPPGAAGAGLLPEVPQQAVRKTFLIAARPTLPRRSPSPLATRYFPPTVDIHKAMHAIPCLSVHSALNISPARQACENRAGKVIAPSRACLIYAQTEGATRLHSFYAHFPQFRDVAFAIRGASDVVIFARQENAELRGACALFDFRLEIERLTPLH